MPLSLWNVYYETWADFLFFIINLHHASSLDHDVNLVLLVVNVGIRLSYAQQIQTQSSPNVWRNKCSEREALPVLFGQIIWMNNVQRDLGKGKGRTQKSEFRSQKQVQRHEIHEVRNNVVT